MKYFTFSEFEESKRAKELHIDNRIPDNLKHNIEELCDVILDPLRLAWGSGIRITSGYRGPVLNKAVKGSSTSAHCNACAADLQPTNGKIEEFKNFVRNWLASNKVPYDQYINEYSGNASWVHIGWKNGEGKQRRQNLLYRNGKYSLLK